MALFARNRFRALGALVICAGLMGVGGEAIGGHEGDEHADFTLSGGAVGVSIAYGTTTEATYTLGSAGTVGSITSGFASNTFILATDITGDNPALRLGGAFINTGASGEFQLNSGGVADRIDFTNTPLGGRIGLQNIDTITIDGGTVNDAINASAATAGVTFNLLSGTIETNVVGSDADDTFIIGSGITVSGRINGRDGTADEVRLIAGAVVASVAFANTPPTGGAVHLQDIETITLDGGRVNGTIDASGATAGVTFNLLSGTIETNVVGSDEDDTFIIGSGITIGGTIDGGGGTNTLSLATGVILTTANLFNETLLTLGLPGGGSIEFTLASIAPFTFPGFTLTTVAPPLTFPAATAGADTFSISTDITDSTDPNQRPLESVIDGLGGDDVFELNTGAVVASVAFSSDNPTGGPVHLQNIETITLNGGTVNGGITGSGLDDTFIIAGDITPGSPNLLINGVIDGGTGTDELQLNTGAVVASIAFMNTAPTADSGELHLQNIETITMGGGTVMGAITGPAAAATYNVMSGTVGTPAIADDPVTISTDESMAATGNITGGAAADIFNLLGGTINGDVNGGGGADSFVISAGITIGGMIDGGAGMDTLSLAMGFTPDDMVLFNGATDSPSLVLAFSGSIIELSLASIETLPNDLAMGTSLTFTPTAGADAFAINTDLISSLTLRLLSVINGDTASSGTADTEDELQLNAGAVVASVTFSSTPPRGGAVHLQNIETITLNGGMVNGMINANPAFPPRQPQGGGIGITFNLVSGRAGPIDAPTGCGRNDCVAIIGTGRNDTFIITGDIIGDFTGDNPELDINGFIHGAGGNDDNDEVVLGMDGVTGTIYFDEMARVPVGFLPGMLALHTVEIVTIDGGTVNGSINAASSTAPTGGTIFNLMSGTITGNVIGSTVGDTFNLHAAIRIDGYLDGERDFSDGVDVLNYMGATVGTTGFPGCGGLAQDGNITDGGGDVRDIEAQAELSGGGTCTPPSGAGAGGAAGADGAPAPGAGLRGLTVLGIEVLNLSPALNLYGALSDALMQFGAQTAQGFALADLNLATGRATQLMSKDSPFTKGRIWTHKITHSGNGKGSIGLNLTGLTARAESDYNYEMSLTQHGFDAPLATTRLGAFNLRAVSHTMTGVIETNVAEAQVSGYGAGVALLWNGETFSAHITSLAGAYEVEAHTSPFNPRAVVSEITEGSFSAINAVVSAGVADTRKLAYGLSLRTSADLVWQTLSLDDFTETGRDGIIINFDKATRLTARVGAGLEAEHWFSDVVFVHETSSGGTLSSGLSQDYKQDDGTAIEMKLGGKVADLATGLTLKAYAGLRTSLINGATLDPSARFDLSWRF